MKAVLLTCSTGQGHNAAAAAICEALMNRGATCEIVDALTFLGEGVSGVIESAFVNIAVKTPRAFGFMYAAGEFVSSDKRKSPVYYANALYAENLHRYLLENDFDAAICPHLFPAEALTFLKRKQRLKLKTYFVSTDYVCIPFLEETDPDCIFTPNADLAPCFVSRGIPNELLSPVGIPVLNKYTLTTPKSEARTQVDLPNDLPVFLVMTGGEGCGDALTLTRKLLERQKSADCRIVVLVGRNVSLGESIRARFGSDVRVRVVPFTEQVETYLDACDVLLTKPGGISSTEAAVKNVPMIHTPPIPGCETLNAQFFSERGMSILAPTEDAAADNALRLVQDEKARSRMLEAQKQYTLPLAAQNVASRIMDDLQSI